MTATLAPADRDAFDDGPAPDSSCLQVAGCASRRRGMLVAYVSSPVVKALVGRILVGFAPEALLASQLDV